MLWNEGQAVEIMQVLLRKTARRDTGKKNKTFQV